jgi:hypothetical protein
MKIVINKCYGGYGLSHKAIMRYGELKGINLVTDENSRYRDVYVDTIKNENYFSEHEIERNDPTLVQVVEELSEKASGPHAELKVVEIPDDVKWKIEEYDGVEWVAEQHRTWH